MAGSGRSGCDASLQARVVRLSRAGASRECRPGHGTSLQRWHPPLNALTGAGRGVVPRPGGAGRRCDCNRQRPTVYRGCHAVAGDAVADGAAGWAGRTPGSGRDEPETSREARWDDGPRDRESHDCLVVADRARRLDDRPMARSRARRSARPAPRHRPCGSAQPPPLGGSPASCRSMASTTSTSPSARCSIMARAIASGDRPIAGPCRASCRKHGSIT